MAVSSLAKSVEVLLREAAPAGKALTPVFEGGRRFAVDVIEGAGSTAKKVIPIAGAGLAAAAVLPGVGRSTAEALASVGAGVGEGVNQALLGGDTSRLVAFNMALDQAGASIPFPGSKGSATQVSNTPGETPSDKPIVLNVSTPSGGETKTFQSSPLVPVVLGLVIAGGAYLAFFRK